MNTKDFGQMQEVFAYILVLQNCLQTTFEKTQDNLTLKQWMMLDAVGNTPKPHTLTNIGLILGCSRQNAKKIAMTLSKKAYIRLVLGAQNSVNIELTRKGMEYKKKTTEKHEEILHLLFSHFDEKEMWLFYKHCRTLYMGIEEIEKRFDATEI